MIEDVSNVFGVRLADLRSTSRGRLRIALARQVWMWGLREQGLCWSAVGRIVHRDRTTCRHAWKRVEALRDIDPEFREKTERVRTTSPV